MPARIEMSRHPWATVIGSMIATSFGAGPVLIISFGIFLVPVISEFGWSRQTMALALLLATSINALATPFVGRAIDRFGARRVALTAVPLFALCTMALSLNTGSVALFFLLYLLWGLTSAAHSQVCYVTGIAKTFPAETRGLALSIGMLGISAGTAIVPPMCAGLVAAIGWRWAYVTLGAITFVVSFGALFFLFRPRDRENPLNLQLAKPGEPSTVSAFRMIRKSWRFWCIAVSVFLLAIGLNGLIAHVVPVLTSGGLTVTKAASIASVIGISAAIGRPLSGWLVDRLNPSMVAAAFFFAPILGLLAIYSESHILLMAAMVPLGFAAGAESDLAGVLVSRYVNLTRFGEVFGYIALAFSAGVGAGPWLQSIFFDRTGSYDAGIMAGSVCIAASGLSVLLLGRPRPGDATDY